MADGNEQKAIRAEVTATLAQYDKTREPALLQDAGDQISREDGSIPTDPDEAKRVGHDRVALWLDLFARFKRDLDPKFDPDNAPSSRVSPPPFKGMQLMPGVDPSQIPDPAVRRQYEKDIANNKERVSKFLLQVSLHEIHSTVLERAGESIRDAHENLGLTAKEITAALTKGNIAAADRDALRKSALE